MSEHTPGPWTIHPYTQDGLQPISSDDGEIWVYRGITFGHGNKVIGTLQLQTASKRQGYPHVELEEELEANANLVIAAPDLLAALKKTMAILTAFAGSKDIGGAEADHLTSTVGTARDAIAKAEGRIR